MGRGVRKWTEQLVAQRVRDGYGEGRGATYKPWVGTADFSSSGRIRRAYSQKFGRTIQLLSDVEWHTFLLLEFANGIGELYENFPTERTITLQIAAALGIAHPYYPGTDVPAVMTIDFLAVNHDGDVIRAFDAKRTEDAQDERAIEKLQIKREYCTGRGIAHHLVFHSALPMVKVRNIEWIRGGILKEEELEPYSGYFHEKAQLMASELSRTRHNLPLNNYCSGFDSRHGLRPGDGLRIAKILMWERRLQGDIGNFDLQNAPLLSFRSITPENENCTASGA
jgi:hypothetical protein